MTQNYSELKMTQQMADMARDAELHRRTLEEISERSRTDSAVKAKRKRDEIRYSKPPKEILEIKSVKEVEVGWVIKFHSKDSWDAVVINVQLDSKDQKSLRITSKPLNVDGTYNEKAPDFIFWLDTEYYEPALDYVWDTGKRMTKKVYFE